MLLSILTHVVKIGKNQPNIATLYETCREIIWIYIVFS